MPAHAEPRSYTQWEYEIAQGRGGGPGRKVIPTHRLFVADALPGHWPEPPHDDADAQRQHRFIAGLLAQGVDRDVFERSAVADCSRLVLRSLPPAPTRRERRTLAGLSGVVVLTLAAGLYSQRPPLDAMLALQAEPRAGTPVLQLTSALNDDLAATLRTADRQVAVDTGPWVRLLGQARLSITGSVSQVDDRLRLRLKAHSGATGAPRERMLDLVLADAQAHPDALVQTVLSHLGVGRSLGLVIGPDRARPDAPQATLLHFAAKQAASHGRPADAKRLLQRALAVSPNFHEARVQQDALEPPSPAPGPPPSPESDTPSPDADLPHAPPLNSQQVGNPVPTFTGMLLGKTVLPDGPAPQVQVLESIDWRTRLTTVFFARASHTLKVLEPDAAAGARGTTVNDARAASAVLVSNGADFNEDHQRRKTFDGLVVIDRAVRSDVPSPKRGALAVRDGEVRILFDWHSRFDDWRGHDHLLQAGPVLVHPGGQWGSGDPLGRHSRTAVCTTSGHFGFVFVEALGAADRLRPRDNRLGLEGGLSLAELGHLLHKPPRDGGLGCDAAIALDGGLSTGFVYRGAGRPLRSQASPRSVVTLVAVVRR